MATATGQITIIDYNDALTLSGFISSNQVKTQMYNPDNGSYAPDWTKSPYLVLTASLFKIGTTKDIITSENVQEVKWFEIVNGEEVQMTATDTRVFGGTKNHVLTLKSNEMAGKTGMDYICRIKYHDDGTNLDLYHKIAISFSRVVNGSGIVDAIALCPNGNVFKNGDVASLTATCDLWRGSVADTSDVSYQWYKQNASITTDFGGGAGWEKLTDTAGKYMGVTTREMTVYPDAFTNLGVFKCGIKDMDSASATYNSCFWDVVTMIDNTDPIALQITSTGGDVFKNGEGSSILKALLYQAGEEIDQNGTKYTYTWSKYKKDGTLDDSFSKTGKSISVTENDVDVKSTFVCTVS